MKEPIINNGNPMRPRFRSCMRLAIAVIACGVAAGALQGADLRHWEQTPYRVYVEVEADVDANADVEAVRLASRLFDHADATLHPLWILNCTAATGERRDACRRMDAISFDELPAEAKGADKFVQFMLRKDSLGYQIQAREYDAYVRRWSPIQYDRVTQRTFIDEASFALLYRTLSPLATITQSPDDADRVLLQFKGSKLPRRAAEPPVELGLPLIPLLRRTTRTGELTSKGVAPVPWTYLVADQRDEAGWSARVHSGLRSPFSTRRQGLVEPLALVVRPNADTTRVRFYPRAGAAQGLIGYEVFRQRAGEDFQLLAVTDETGSVAVPPSEDRVVNLVLRSDGLLLAKTPVIPGMDPLVEIPIGDDNARLRAQAEIRALREELVDLVAHRAILSARIQAKLAAGQVDAANQFMDALNELPLQSVFERRIEAARRVNRSDDTKVQSRIDQLFTDTQQILGRFLNVRQITELQAKVNAARTSAPETSVP